MITKSEVKEVRNDIGGYIGQKVLLRGSKGRNQFFEEEGTLVSTYSNHFLVKNGLKKMDFRYEEVLNKKVEFNIVDSNGGYTSILDNGSANITL